MRYLRSWWVRIGLVLLVLGTGPLVGVLVAARLGWGDDPNPNPVLLGMLAAATFWPSIILIGIGVWRTRSRASA